MAKQTPVVPARVALWRLPSFIRKPLKNFDRYVDEYGPSFFLQAGRDRRTLVTTEPEVAQAILQKEHRRFEKSVVQTGQMALYFGKGLLTNSGEDWLRQRRLIQPGFHREKLAALIQSMEAECERMSEEMQAKLQGTDQVLEVHELMTALTFRIIARTIFTDGFTPKQTEEFSEAVTRLQSFIIYPIRLPILRPLLRLSGHQRHYQRIAREVGRQLLDRAVARRQSAEKKPDLLQMLLDSRYEDNGEPMNDRQLIDEIMILFAAGHETSANALTWTLHLLADHPEEMDRCRAEVERELPDGRASLENLAKLTYVQQVLEESMRLYPPAWVTDRVALTEVEVAGIRVREGEMVVPYIYGLHRSKLLYEQPTRFRPERMSTTQKRSRHSFSLIPFGGGPRLCIGHHFAMLEMKLVLAHILRNWDFRRSTSSPANVAPQPLITLRPADPIRFHFSRP